MLAVGGACPFNARVREARYDAVVIGGGPGGSAAGSYLAMAGKKVLIVEKEVFPRFHVGESLLPYNQVLLRELGVVETLEKLACPTKYGAQFHLGNRSKSVKVLFRNGKFNREHRAFQVERSVFDEVLLRNAAAKGASVVEGATVREVDNRPSGVALGVCDREGRTTRCEADYVVDATGRDNLTGARDGLRENHPDLRKVAVFSHFSKVHLDPGPASGDTVIVRTSNGWFWLIPIGVDKISVGAVLDVQEYREMGLKPEAALKTLFQNCPEMQARMADAQSLIPAQVTSDFSYQNRRLIGPRLLRVGDAAGFVDPIFSSGVHLAMSSGKSAAQAILNVLDRGLSEGKAFAAYEKRFLRALAFCRELVEHYYTTPFMEVLLEPRREIFSLVDAVNGALAGQFAESWSIRWRMRMFYRLVRLQAKRPFLPRIRFD